MTEDIPENWPYKKKKVVSSSKTEYPTDRDTEYRFKYNDGSESKFSIPKHLENARVKPQSGGVQSKGFTEARNTLGQAGVESNASTSASNNNNSNRRSSDKNTSEETTE